MARFIAGTYTAASGHIYAAVLDTETDRYAPFGRHDFEASLAAAADAARTSADRLNNAPTDAWGYLWAVRSGGDSFTEYAPDDIDEPLDDSDACLSCEIDDLCERVTENAEALSRIRSDIADLREAMDAAIASLEAARPSAHRDGPPAWMDTSTDEPVGNYPDLGPGVYSDVDGDLWIHTHREGEWALLTVLGETVEDPADVAEFRFASEAVDVGITPVGHLFLVAGDRLIYKGGDYYILSSVGTIWRLTDKTARPVALPPRARLVPVFITSPHDDYARQAFLGKAEVVLTI